MKNQPNFSREISKELKNRPTRVPKRIAEITEPTSDSSDQLKNNDNGNDTKDNNDQHESKKAGRPKKPEKERRKQIILTIGPETYDVLSEIPDFRRKLSHYLDANLKEISKILEEYIIK